MKRSHPDSTKEEQGNQVQTDDSQLLEEETCWKCKGHGRKTQNHLKGYTGKVCPVCQGTGKRQASKKSKLLAEQPGKIIELRGGGPTGDAFAGVPAVMGDWIKKLQPEQSSKLERPPVNAGELVAPLGCGDWRIFQLANGHKLTVDDFLCAWVAAKEMRKRGFGVETGKFGQVPQDPVKKFLHADIGCGCGSVLMMMLWAFPNSIQSHGVEAQQVSYDLCRRGLLWNLGTDGVQETSRVQLSHQDLREWAGDGQFYDVITGTPPYFPKDRFVASENHAQKIRCRVPTRGAASDYLVAAAKRIRRGDKDKGEEPGVVVLVETARSEAEQALLQTIQEVQFRVIYRLDVITRTGLPPRFSCWVMAPKTETAAKDDKEAPTFPIEFLTIRNADQSRTIEYVESMESMGWVDFERTREKLLEKKTVVSESKNENAE
eukprot:Nitzschia sp. Nitz4//scaffold311_size21207//12984//14279//NITZ4_008623-RA/size21207-processed-gene-0.52-mRNA-1//-1//CDS//3329547389//6995//frame0